MPSSQMVPSGPKMTAFHFMMLFASGDAFTPMGGSVLMARKSRTSRCKSDRQSSGCALCGGSCGWGHAGVVSSNLPGRRQMGAQEKCMQRSMEESRASRRLCQALRAWRARCALCSPSLRRWTSFLRPEGARCARSRSSNASNSHRKLNGCAARPGVVQPETYPWLGSLKATGWRNGTFQTPYSQDPHVHDALLHARE